MTLALVVTAVMAVLRVGRLHTRASPVRTVDHRATPDTLQITDQARCSVSLCKVLRPPATPGWRKRFGELSPDDAKRLRELEAENQRLKKPVADQALDIDMLKEIAPGKILSPERRRQA